MISMTTLWTASRARRRAISVIAPLLAASRARMGSIPAGCWRDPYLIGFLSMMISLIAASESRGRIRSEELGRVQAEAWQVLTGLADDRIGEDICLLSAAGNADFIAGCMNASQFMRALCGDAVAGDPDVCELLSGEQIGLDIHAAECAPAFGRGGIVAAALWSRYFEDHVSG